VIKLLIVDDSALLRKLIGKVFAAEPDFELAFARNGLEALEKVRFFGPDVVTLDVQMPDLDGLACLDRIMLERPCPVVMVASLTPAGAEATLEAYRLGAVDFIAKPTVPVSLHFEDWAPELLRKVRMAAQVKIRSSLRLSERIRRRNGGNQTGVASVRAHGIGSTPAKRVTGDGLVLIGSSTGGPPALEAVLTALPSQFAWPILVAQHMPASFTGALAKRLDGICALDVVEVAKPAPLRPGAVYIARGDADMIVSRRPGGLVAMAAPARPDYLWHPSTDRLVRSAMDCLPASQLIGVLMTGMGSDGAEAMTLMHGAGGKVIAEAEETAVVWGMPGALVKAGGADWILPLGRIAHQLRKLTP